MDFAVPMQDADNLQKINRESITRGIVESCSVLLYLNNEPLSSEWCRCRETAKLLNMGEVTPLRALNSFYEHHFSRDELLPALEEMLFDVESGDAPILMVTHFVTISAVTGKAVSSGDLVVYDPMAGESFLFYP